LSSLESQEVTAINSEKIILKLKNVYKAYNGNGSTGTDRVVIFQEGALFPWLTVYENIKFRLKIAKLTKDRRNEIVMRYIDMVQLSGFAYAFVHQLSGGCMRQSSYR